MQTNELLGVGALAYVGWREVYPRISKFLHDRKANNPALREMRELASISGAYMTEASSTLASAMSRQQVALDAVVASVTDGVGRAADLAEAVAAKVESPDMPESVKEMSANFEKLMAGQIKACEAIAAEVAGLRETVTAFSKSISASPELPGTEFSPPDAFMKPGSPDAVRSESVLEAILRGHTPAQAQLMADEREEQSTALSAVDPIS